MRRVRDALRVPRWAADDLRRADGADARLHRRAVQVVRLLRHPIPANVLVGRMLDQVSCLRRKHAHATTPHDTRTRTYDTYTYTLHTPSHRTTCHAHPCDPALPSLTASTVS